MTDQNWGLELAAFLKIRVPYLSGLRVIASGGKLSRLLRWITRGE